MTTKHEIFDCPNPNNLFAGNSGFSNATKDSSTNQTQLIRGKCQVRETTSSLCKTEKIGKHTLLADDSTDEAESGRLHCMRNGSFRKLSIILFL